MTTSTSTPTFTGPTRGRDYKGKPTRTVSWQWDSGESTGDEIKRETHGVRLEVHHDSRRKQYTVALQACSVGDTYYMVQIGLPERGGHAHRTLEVVPAPRFSEKKFAELVDYYAGQAERLCAAFYAGEDV